MKTLSTVLVFFIVLFSPPHFSTAHMDVPILNDLIVNEYMKRAKSKCDRVSSWMFMHAIRTEGYFLHLYTVPPLQSYVHTYAEHGYKVRLMDGLNDILGFFEFNQNKMKVNKLQQLVLSPGFFERSITNSLGEQSARFVCCSSFSS